MKSPLLIIAFSIFIINCGGQPESFSTTAPADIPIEEPVPGNDPEGSPNVDPWSAPVGAEIPGVTLKDGWYDLRELPESINLSAGWTDSAAIGRGGKSLYFSYSRFSFAELVENNSWTVTGLARPGMTGNYFKNFRADLTAKGWVVNYLPFNSDPEIHESSIAVNADENLAVFSRWASTGTSASLYFSKKDQFGNWSTPLKLPENIFGTICSNDNPFIVGDLANGVDLYFESDRADINCTSKQEKKHIYHTFYNPSKDQYSAITKVVGINGVDAEDDDTQFYISADKQHAFWTAVRPARAQYGIFTADVVNGVFVNARPVVEPTTSAPFTGKLVFPGEANVVELPQGYLMYMMCGMATRESGKTHGVQLKICRAKKNKFSDEAKKINTSTGWSDSPFISRDGNRLYFAYSRWDFSPWILDSTKLPVLKGPDRLGLRHNTVNPFDESDIYMATKNADGTWSEPVNLGLSDSWGDASGMEINNGESFVWLRSNGAQSNIVVANKNSDGTWGEPIDVGAGINIPGVTQDNPHLSADGKALWFTSDRSGGAGGKDIWFTTKSAAGWSNPVNAVGFNTSGFEDQFFLAPNNLDIYWTGPVGTMHCVSNGSGCAAAADLIAISGCPYVAEVSMPNDMQTMYFGCGNPTTGRVQIMYSRKNSNGTWGPAVLVD